MSFSVIFETHKQNCSCKSKNRNDVPQNKQLPDLRKITVFMQTMHLASKSRNSSCGMTKNQG